MRSLALLLPLAVLPLGACGGDDDTRQGNPGEDFRRDTDVLITSHTNGETVQSPFLLGYDAGADVRKVRLDVDDQVSVTATRVGEDGTGELSVTLEPGRYRFTLVGLDKDEAELEVDLEKLLIAEKQMLEAAAVPTRDPKAELVGARNRGR